MLDLLITVPHGAPGNDRGAPAVAEALHWKLKDHGYEVRTLLSRTCRYTAIDMNRDSGRGTQFRSNVRHVMMETRPQLHIDVHSFPADIPRFSGQDIVLLHGYEHPDAGTPLQDWASLCAYAQVLSEGGATACVQPSEYPNDVCQHVVSLGQPRDRCILAEHNDGGDPDLYALAHVHAISSVIPLVKAGVFEKYDGRAGPRYKALKKGKVRLTPEERELVMAREAVWHHGVGGAETAAVWKSVVRGKTWYVTNTHRAGCVMPTLKGAIKMYHDSIKSTAEGKEGQDFDGISARMDDMQYQRATDYAAPLIGVGDPE